MIGTWNPRMAALAGETADEVKIGGSANPEMVPLMREWIGNDDVRIVVGAVTVVDEDGDPARARAADEVRMYLDAGAGRVEFGTPQGLSTAGGVALLRDRVLPLLR
jgi:5,10-methylenetetrahydromethanopterin reductase